MGNNIKAIETRYKGYRFRSRLEARWAVFFDALGISYKYEPEGFDLSKVKPPVAASEVRTELLGADAFYLPDFFLPEQESYVEVKPFEPTKIEAERAARLSWSTEKSTVIVVGEPWCDESKSGYSDSQSGYINFADGCWDNFYMLTACQYCRRVDWCFSGWAGRLSCECPNSSKGSGDFARLLAAYTSARSARFEHGDEPQMVKTFTVSLSDKSHPLRRELQEIHDRMCAGKSLPDDRDRGMQILRIIQRET